MLKYCYYIIGNIFLNYMVTCLLRNVKSVASKQIW